MRKVSFIIPALMIIFCVNVFGKPGTTLTTDTIIGAQIPPEIENPELLGINKEPAHASLMAYNNLDEAFKANRHDSSFCRNLNGLWKFNWVARPEQRPVDFYKPAYDVSKWKDIPVPSNWQVLGYGTPIYKNEGFTTRKDFPRVMSEPPTTYTAYIERNPVGSYRREFEVPQNWKGRRLFLTFDGVDAAFFLWINGEKVGYSVNSRNAAEFDVTKYIKPGKNMVAVEVYRYCSGSYLEDQDMWRLSGIFRNVTIWSTPNIHVRDFFVKTDLDPQYKNATVEVITKIKNYSDKQGTAQSITATLFDTSPLGDLGVSKEVTGSKAQGNVPALKPGEETLVILKFPVANPVKWNAESPRLYTTVITLNEGGKDIETLSSRTGFRKIEIKGRIFMVNGTPVKLKGANRHENWPESGHAVTEAQMIRDLELLKQANCNHVRTSHYSDDPRWYELCDEYGIWLIAEANVECHGYHWVFDNEPRVRAAIIDRNVANTENFKNHPSIIIWSLGNENGAIGSNFIDAENTIKAIDPTRYVHYEGFGIKKDNPADIDSRMYASTAEVEKIATDSSYSKPFYLCEYAHAMFNSMGSIGEYNDLFDKYPAILGGAVWEWEDQGLFNRRDPNHPIIAFGGGFGDFPNDHYFIHKGVVSSDRSPKPHYPEMKRVYQWIDIKAENPAQGIFKIRNRYQFITLDGFNANWSLSENGKDIATGKIELPKIVPGAENSIHIPFVISKHNTGSEYFLRISFVLNKDEIWAKKGYEVAAGQFKIGSDFWTTSNTILKSNNPTSGLISQKVVNTSVTLQKNEKEFTVKGKNFAVAFNKVSGTFTRIEQGNINLLTADGGPKLHLWRAPHIRDDMWAAKDWYTFGLNELRWAVLEAGADQSDPATVRITAKLKGEGKSGFEVSHNVVYTIKDNGSITADNNVSSNNPQLVIARMGIRMFLGKQFDRFNYFGRGPMENYSDRKRGFDIGLYHSSVKEQLTPYEKPMECGNHEDVRWASLTGSNGLGLMAKCSNSVMQVSALPYSDEELEKPEYRIDLPESKATVLCVSHQTLGVGSASCGPKPIKQFVVYAEPASFTYVLQLLNGRINNNVK